MTVFFRFALCVMVMANIAACSESKQHNKPVDKTLTYAVAPSNNTAIGSFLQKRQGQFPGKSAFRLVTFGSEAFFARVNLIRMAEKTLDLQYYIIEDDLTGSMLLEEVLRAGERGVRVRLLVDELAASKVQNEISLLDENENISIRSFNPVSLQDETFLTTVTTWLVDFDRANSRMHNKALIVDNQAAIIGGRNLGDQYFDASADFNFGDMDVVAAGPIVQGISRSFDEYWNSDFSFPLEYVEFTPSAPEKLAKIRRDLQKRWKETYEGETGKDLKRAEAMWKANSTDAFPFVWAWARLDIDSPEKVINKTPTEKAEAEADLKQAADKEKSQSGIIVPLAKAVSDTKGDGESTDSEPTISEQAEASKPLERLDELLEHAQSSFHAITPYFVPRDSGVKWLSDMEKRGIEVKVLTNSLDATDVAAVHTGYAKYRPILLRNGVEIFEAKRIADKRSRQNLAGSSSRSSLHAKTYIVDRKYLVIASFNLDPRSIESNTELSITIHSPELAEQALEMFEETTAADRSYSVSLKNPQDTEDDDILWTTQNAEGQTVTFTHEPEASLLRRVKAVLYQMLPIENLL